MHLLKYSFGAICIKCRQQRSSAFAAIKGKHIVTANCGQLFWLGVAKTVDQIVWADRGRKFSKAALYSAVAPVMCVTSQYYNLSPYHTSNTHPYRIEVY